MTGALDVLKRAVHDMTFGGIQVWPTSSVWIEGLEEAVKYGTRSLQEGGSSEIISLINPLKSEFEAQGLDLAEWVKETQEFYADVKNPVKGYDPAREDNIRRGAALAYKVINER